MLIIISIRINLSSFMSLSDGLFLLQSEFGGKIHFSVSSKSVMSSKTAGPEGFHVGKFVLKFETPLVLVLESQDLFLKDLRATDQADFPEDQISTKSLPQVAREQINQIININLCVSLFLF